MYVSAFVFILSMQLLESRSNEAQKGEAEKLPLPGIAKTFSIPSEFHLCTSYTLSTSTFNRKRFLKPGTSGDNVRLDGTEAPETAETTSSPGQSVSFDFHSVLRLNPNIWTSYQPASSLISYLVKLTMSTSTYKKIFFKPGTSTDTSGDIPNVRPDATETPDSAETTSSPGQNVSFGFHPVSCGKLSTQI